MKFLRGLIVVGFMLGLHTVIGRVWSDLPRYVDLMVVPVVWFGIRTNQRQATIGGCVTGLLHDTWFELHAFGIGGFKRTLLGWILGGVGSRFDLNRIGGRFLAGGLTTLADGIIDYPLREMLEVENSGFEPGILALRTILTAVVVVISFAVIDLLGTRRRRSGWGP
ncbi:MAG: hypothetical protein OEV00_06640 [Acidobacteriota bacterium]|nr:hypothetical protein [Acidobacteriota bacterium]MDH3784987.1 hypothetical protein [Acidobacteriota bacterium]